jgi:DNA-binding transcriptional MerR regulator/quercetin dioxygenase-like cupin family protein
MKLDAMNDGEIAFSISEAADMLGVSTSTLRAWEAHGVITPRRTESGHRRYTVDDVEFLRRMSERTHAGVRGREGQDSADLDAASERQETQEVHPPDWAVRLRHLRQELGYSLREAAARTSLSASFISTIERGQANPSIAALQKLTAAYGTSIVELMGGASATSRMLVRPQDRQTYDKTAGVVMEQLNFGLHQMELHLFTVDPGAGTGETYHHVGEEFIFLLSGELVVWIDRIERFHLQAGDVLYFESTRPHEWLNPGDEPAVFLGVNTPATF